MKTNFKNVFNEWEDDLIDISENTLIEDTIVSGDSVKSRVFSELGINKKKKPFSNFLQAKNGTQPRVRVKNN